MVRPRFPPAGQVFIRGRVGLRFRVHHYRLFFFLLTLFPLTVKHKGHFSFLHLYQLLMLSPVSCHSCNICWSGRERGSHITAEAACGWGRRLTRWLCWDQPLEKPQQCSIIRAKCCPNNSWELARPGWGVRAGHVLQLAWGWQLDSPLQSPDPQLSPVQSVEFRGPLFFWTYLKMLEWLIEANKKESWEQDWNNLPQCTTFMF